MRWIGTSRCGSVSIAQQRARTPSYVYSVLIVLGVVVGGSDRRNYAPVVGEPTSAICRFVFANSLVLASIMNTCADVTHESLSLGVCFGALQAAINVDSDYITAHVDAIAQNDPSVHVLAAGEVVTEGYLDTMAEDVNVQLQQLGQVTIGDVATSFQLPITLVGTWVFTLCVHVCGCVYQPLDVDCRHEHNAESALASRLGVIVQAELRGRTFYTSVRSRANPQLACAV